MARPISRAYWNSCSNGGRQGLIEAQRFPDDFDGIVANAPWSDQTGFTIGAMWNQKALSQSPVTAAKLALVADKVMAKCDAIDGLKDGLIDDPRKCNFDPARDVPACSAGADNADCLTPAQAETVAKIYSGPIEQRQAFLHRLHAGERSRDHGLVRRACRQRPASGWMNVIVSRAAGRRYPPISTWQTTPCAIWCSTRRSRTTTTRLSIIDRDIHLLDDMEQAGRRQEPRPVEVPETRRQVADDIRLGRHHPSAHGER